MSDYDGSLSAPEFIQQRSEGMKKKLNVLRGRFRKSLTGDERKSVRRYFRDIEEQKKNKILKTIKSELSNPKFLRLMDRASFTFGVTGIVVTEYIMLIYPQYFWLLFSVVMPCLMLARYHMYKRSKHQYFMIDFCYLVQVLVLFEVVFPSPLLFTMNFMFANGPLAWAVIAWRNSLVFHSIDKVTSVFIHVFPMIVSYCEKWYCGRGTEPLDGQTFCSAIAVYLIWQMLYLFEVEIRQKKKFESDKDLTTSLRYLSEKGHSIPSVIMVRKALAKIGLAEENEAFDSTSHKTKLIMIGSQLLYTLATMIPVLLLYNSQVLHTVFMNTMLIWSVWNGATYYFEVFAASYNKPTSVDLTRSPDTSSSNASLTPRETDHSEIARS